MSPLRVESAQAGDENIRDYYPSRSPDSETAASNAVFTTTGRYGLISAAVHANNKSIYIES